MTDLSLPREVRPSRAVLDAHVAARDVRAAQIARRAGIPLLIDPQTFYLQGQQHPADPWAQLPFARSSALGPVDLLDHRRQDQLIAECLGFQLVRGATILIPPYVHIERSDNGWVAVQASLFRRTRRYLDQRRIQLPVTTVIALSWRLTGRTTWPSTLFPLLRALEVLAPDEVALAASRVDQGRHPDHRLADLYAAISLLTTHGYPTLAWNQGVLGEAAVAAGATGYETGIGWRERCDLQTRMNAHRAPPAGRFGARPVYITRLGASLPRPTIQAVLSDPVAGPLLICADIHCCPNGSSTLLGDARHHAVIARSRRLAQMIGTSHHAWAWGFLANEAASALRLAERINTVARRRDGLARIDTSSLSAVATTAHMRRQRRAA